MPRILDLTAADDDEGQLLAETLNRAEKRLKEIDTEMSRLNREKNELVRSFWLTFRNIDTLRVKQVSLRNEGKRKELSRKFSWSDQVLRLKNSVYKIADWRPNQEEIINATLSGEDCFVVMPTGGGKSLCYMVTLLVIPSFPPTFRRE